MLRHGNAVTGKRSPERLRRFPRATSIESHVGTTLDYAFEEGSSNASTRTDTEGVGMVFTGDGRRRRQRFILDHVLHSGPR